MLCRAVALVGGANRVGFHGAGGTDQSRNHWVCTVAPRRSPCEGSHSHTTTFPDIGRVLARSNYSLLNTMATWKPAGWITTDQWCAQVRKQRGEQVYPLYTPMPLQQSGADRQVWLESADCEYVEGPRDAKLDAAGDVWVAPETEVTGGPFTWNGAKRMFQFRHKRGAMADPWHANC